MNKCFVEIKHEGESLVLIIGVDQESGSADLIISKNYFSAERSSQFKDFASLENAQSYCLSTYGVAKSDWTDKPKLSQNFEFEFALSDYGVPQPHTIGFPGAKIKVVFAPAPSVAGDPQPNQIEISGNAAGLRMLAAQLLLCADSHTYDPWFHIHFKSDASNLEMTLYAPSYFDRWEKKTDDRRDNIPQGELLLVCDLD